ncbi:hypothetical protein Nm8I071_05620 [Nonomuraea sp. TT08I-71]|nr:hypothetical protein Nm8I071_05620 [Nonomuraea sp. TT08I-71]
MAFQSLSPCRSRTSVPTVGPSLAVMRIILPYRADGHAGTGRDDHHVEKLMTGVPGRH